MRRKLFFYVFLLVVITAGVLTVCNDLGVGEYKDKDTKSNHSGKIVLIENDNNESLNLVVKLDSGDKVLLNYQGNQVISQICYGASIRFYSSLEIPSSNRNPKCFDYKLYLKSKGIKYISETKDIVIDKEISNIYDKYCRFLLTKKEAFLYSISNDTARSFIDGILFGNSSGLEENLYDDFKANGTAHILAVSGLHINVVYGVLQKIIGKRHSSINLIITVVILWSLGILAGWTPSVTRAIGMIFLKIYALYNDLRYDSLTSASMLALLMIIVNPYVIFNVSFQMSFLAVMSIIFLLPHIPSKIPDYMAIIIAVNVGLLPYQIFKLNSISLTSLIANIPVVYLATTLLPIILIQFLIFVFTGLNVNYLLISIVELIIKINRICTLGMESLNVQSLPFWSVIFIYLICGFLASETFYLLVSRKNIKCIISILLSLCIITCISSLLYTDGYNDSEIVFVDVGQGDCIHIKADNKDILIDGGGSTNYEVGKNTLMPYLLKNGVSKVDLAMATHKHIDHYKGLEELKEEGLIDSIKVGLVAGKEYRISKNIFIETIWPLDKPQNDVNQDENKNCSVFMINYNGYKIMITGDLDIEGEQQMLEYYGDTNTLKADILKIGHHGSQYSTSMEFLANVDPQYCVIQVGKNNYGHPHAKTIEKCEEKGIIILRNDMQGAIGFSLDEETIKYNTML